MFLTAENSRVQTASVDLVRPLVGTAPGNVNSQKQGINGMDVQDDAREQQDDLFDFDYQLGPGPPVADVEGEDEVNAQEELEIPAEMEGRAAVGLRTQVSVSKAQKDDHEFFHCPYRARFSVCVKA